MDEKLNIQNLIDTLAEKHGMSKKNADSFVREFFLLIEESLEKDKYVKVKGLGTFKLIDVESRESINVNTGERFEIQGHTKVSFTPDANLKEAVNKPFSYFETVPLNDDVVLEDTPMEDTAIENATEENVAEESTPIVEPNAEDKKSSDVEKDTVVTPPKEEKKKLSIKERWFGSADSATMKYFIAIVIFVIILCAGAIIFLYYPDALDDSPTTIEQVDESNGLESLPSDNNESLADSASLAAEPYREAPAEESASQQSSVATPSTYSDSASYTIVGTETTYTVQPGESLTRISLRFYGVKSLWTYIVKHNPDVITNPDNVPSGTTIKIPKLVEKQ